jgi:hypothetical protein
MKTTLTAALTSLLFAGSAFAADGVGTNGFRIESESQFLRDYGDQIEPMAPGVYQVVKGPLAGKTVTLGETGLRYDLAALRAQTPGSRQERAQIKAQLRLLESTLADFSKLREYETQDLTRQSTSGTFPCAYYNWRTGRTIRYNGYAQVTATTELYLDNGGGGLNFYYARASAIASGTVFRPYSVPPSLTMTAYAFAKNHYTGQVAEQTAYGITSAWASSGYVYSGPTFSHNMSATSTVAGQGDCFGYVSVSDTLQM